MTLRAEEVDTQKTCMNVDHWWTPIGTPPWLVPRGAWRFCVCRGSGLQSLNASPMKRVGSEVPSPVKPPIAVRGGLSQPDTQPDPPPRQTRVCPRPTPLSLRLPMTRTPPGSRNRSRTPAEMSARLPILLFLVTRLALLSWFSPHSLACPHPPIAASCRCRPLRWFRGPAPSVQVANSDILHARAWLHSRVAAQVVSGPRVPPPASAFSPFHDGLYWCSKCRRRGFGSYEALHPPPPRARSFTMSPALCSWPLSASRARPPSSASLRRSAARVCYRCGQATHLAPRIAPLHPCLAHASKSLSCCCQ